MTGAVHASSPVRRADPEKRLLDYRSAAYLWLTESRFTEILYLDGSNTSILNRALFQVAEREGKYIRECLFDFGAIAQRFGKGRAEANLLTEGVKQIENCFYKVSGRLFVQNHFELLQDERECLCQVCPRGGMDTQFFKCSARAFDEHLAPQHSEIDDKLPETYIEEVYGRAMEWSRFQSEVRYFGVCGTTNTPY